MVTARNILYSQRDEVEIELKKLGEIIKKMKLHIRANCTEIHICPQIKSLATLQAALD